MSRARLIRQVRQIVELRAVCELAPDWQRRYAWQQYNRAIRLLVFGSALSEDRLATIAERHFVSWLRNGKTPAIRRAKARASERTWGEAMRVMREAALGLPGSDAR